MRGGQNLPLPLSSARVKPMVTELQTDMQPATNVAHYSCSDLYICSIGNSQVSLRRGRSASGHRPSIRSASGEADQPQVSAHTCCRGTRRRHTPACRHHCTCHCWPLPPGARRSRKSRGSPRPDAPSPRSTHPSGGSCGSGGKNRPCQTSTKPNGASLKSLKSVSEVSKVHVGICLKEDIIA